MDATPIVGEVVYRYTVCCFKSATNTKMKQIMEGGQIHRHCDFLYVCVGTVWTTNSNFEMYIYIYIVKPDEDSSAKFLPYISKNKFQF